jgi:hypothetical protein
MIGVAIVGRTVTLAICIGLISNKLRGLICTTVDGRIVSSGPDGLTATGTDGLINVGMCFQTKCQQAGTPPPCWAVRTRSGSDQDARLDVRLCRKDLLAISDRLVKIVVEAKRSTFGLVELKAVQIELCQNIPRFSTGHDLDIFVFAASVGAGDRYNYLFHLFFSFCHPRSGR